MLTKFTSPIVSGLAVEVIGVSTFDSELGVLPLLLPESEAELPNPDEPPTKLGFDSTMIGRPHQDQ